MPLVSVASERPLTGVAAGVVADLFLDLPRLELHTSDGDRVRLSLR